MKKIILFCFIIIVILITSACSHKNIQKDIVITTQNKNISFPIIVIDTKGTKMKITDTEKITATMKIYKDKNLHKLDFESSIGIKIRGNSTRHMPKKQYSIELRNNKGDEKERRILGMSEDSDWVLNAPFEDKSLIRNYMAYTVADKIMDYAPKSKFCEVYLVNDGNDNVTQKHYKGLYLMIEKIKRGQERVDIFSSYDRRGETSFIVAKDASKEGDNTLNTYGKETYIYGKDIVVQYPKRELTKHQIDYITKTISEFERVLYSDKYDVVGKGYSKYINVDSFVDYFIINEFFNNTDAGIASTYIYKDYGEKIKAGPVWDFNSSMGNSSTLSEFYDPAGFYLPLTSWFDRLMSDKNFVMKIINRYKNLRSTYLSDKYLLNFIDNTVWGLGDAPSRNFKVWPIYLCNQAEMFKTYSTEKFEPYIDDINKLNKYLKDNPKLLFPTDKLAKSYEEEIDMLKQFIINRGAWIDKNIESLYKWTD